MTFVRSEKYGPYTIYIAGIEGKEVTSQIYRGGKITTVENHITKKQAEAWCEKQLVKLGIV